MNTPKLIDLNNELKIITFSNKSYNLNTFLFFLSFFIFLLIYIFSKNYSKKKENNYVLNKLKYIRGKSNKYIKAH